MAFNENPYIDQYSKNSERSERRLRDFLNQDSGFICRPDVPDKGCDFDAEIILNATESSNWRFPIQLKSVEKMDLVENEKFISYSLKTSRLGYLMRRLPCMGVVIIYSLEEDNCFYDYADEIYVRLMMERGSDDWKQNDKVNIRIPYSNVLSMSVVSDVHKVFVNRFQQAALMQASHGFKYGLPAAEVFINHEYDFNNKEHIKQFLLKYGTLLLNKHDFDIINKLIVQIPSLEIYLEKDLIFIAAIAYSELGHFSDSELFCKKLRTKPSLTTEEVMILTFVELKNKLALGYITSDDFISQLNNLKENPTTCQNLIILEINITKYELLKIKAFEKIPKALIDAVHKLFDLIEECNCAEKVKDIFRLWNSENFSIIIGHIQTEQLGELKIRESLNDELSLEERKASVLFLVSLEQQFSRILFLINKKAFDCGDKFLKATSLSLFVQHFLQKEINYFMLGADVSNVQEHRKQLENTVSYAFAAFNLFVELSLPKDSYNNLTNGLELLEFAQIYYSTLFGYNKSNLTNIKTDMESKLELTAQPSIVAGLTQIRNKNLNSDSQNENGLPYLEGMNDIQIESLAKTVLKSFHLPEERLTNIINEMKAYRMFHQRCKDPNILIFQFDYVQRTNENAYSIPVQFVLRSKLTNVETTPNSDMEILLTSWGFDF